MFYYTCPHCGAHLDPGEHCDCDKRYWDVMRIYRKNIKKEKRK